MLINESPSPFNQNFHFNKTAKQLYLNNREASDFQELFGGFYVSLYSNSVKLQETAVEKCGKLDVAFVDALTLNSNVLQSEK